jgi:hypothetical protein
MSQVQYILDTLHLDHTSSTCESSIVMRREY